MRLSSSSSIPGELTREEEQEDEDDLVSPAKRARRAIASDGLSKIEEEDEENRANFQPPDSGNHPGTAGGTGSEDRGNIAGGCLIAFLEFTGDRLCCLRAD